MGGIVLLAAIAGGLAFAVLVGLALCIMRKQGLLYCCGGSEPFSAAHRELGGVSGAAGDDGDSGGGGQDRHNDTYTQLEVLAAARPAAAPLASPPPLLAPYGAGAGGKANGVRGAGEERKTKEARYAVGAVLHRNMQDPSVAFKFGSEVGTLEGPQSVGKTIVVDAVYTDERGDMKYRVRDAKASCKVTVLEKHFDQRCEHPTPFVVGDTVVRNNVDRKMEFNMKGSLGIVRPGTVAVVAAVFVDKSNLLKVKYTLKGAVNWLPEEKFATYFTRVDEAELSTSTMATNRDRSDSARKSLPGTGMATPLMDQDIALVA
eukprot:Rhum_TRINITY_DN8182_c0_g1::Rhum_TRINITY_DN8182_c0_g1_i1::g.26607::m.26607